MIGDYWLDARAMPSGIESAYYSKYAICSERGVVAKNLFKPLCSPYPQRCPPGHEGHCLYGYFISTLKVLSLLGAWASAMCHERGYRPMYFYGNYHFRGGRKAA